jgi:hypothetical protein
MPGREDVPESIALMSVSGAAVVIRAEIVGERTHELPNVGPDLLFSILVPYMEHEQAIERSERYAERLRAEFAG